MSRSDVIPKDKTIKELLSEVGNVQCHNNEFIEINKIGMVEIGSMDDFDYEIFWNCMRVYEVSGINYFSQYVYLCKGLYGDFTQGIESWFNRSIMGYRPDVMKTFLELVDVLRFLRYLLIVELTFRNMRKLVKNLILFTKLQQTTKYSVNKKKVRKPLGNG